MASNTLVSMLIFLLNVRYERTRRADDGRGQLPDMERSWFVS